MTNRQQTITANSTNVKSNTIKTKMTAVRNTSKQTGAATQTSRTATETDPPGEDKRKGRETIAISG